MSSGKYVMHNQEENNFNNIATFRQLMYVKIIVLPFHSWPTVLI